jgi:hypothetical protein
MRVLCPWNMIHKNGQHLYSSGCVLQFLVNLCYIIKHVTNDKSTNTITINTNEVSLKLSTLCILAAHHFCLFQLKTHNTVNAFSWNNRKVIDKIIITK